MTSANAKPKLVFFQYQFSENLPAFVLLHRQQQAKCLSEFFEVKVLQSDCDYAQVCDEHEPDLALFEMLSGDDAVAARRLKITNVSRERRVPKLALLNADAWCEASAGFISDMECLGVDAAFSICTTAAEHLPELADLLYVWPNCINPEIHRDYGESKLIPFLLTGASSSQYPWRRAISKRLAEHYPSLVCPHHGYAGGAATARMMWGEGYARTINASWFVPTCGTVAREVVRKHLEIPGCHACLITEKSPALEAAGFVDMQNCLFAEESNVLDKVTHLFNDPAELQRIINAGHQLVHSRHTMRQRDQIFQWFKLHKELTPKRRIVQQDPFGLLAIVEQSSGARSLHLAGGGVHLKLLRQGDEKLADHQYSEAEVLYRQSSNYIHWMPGPKFKLALCSLYRGDAKAALATIVSTTKYVLADYGALEPDPVEWAYLIKSLLCLGRLKAARDRAHQFAWLSHPELDRVRCLAAMLTGTSWNAASASESTARYRRSIHQLPERSFEEWCEEAGRMLEVCGRKRLALILRRRLAAQQSADPRSSSGGSPGVAVAPQAAERPGLGRENGELGRKRVTLRGFDNPLVLERVQARLAAVGAGSAQGLQRGLRAFFPSRFRRKEDDGFCQALRGVVQAESIKTALIIGAAARRPGTEVFLRVGAGGNGQPSVFCANGATRGFVKLQKAFASHAVIKCYNASIASANDFAKALYEALERIKQDYQIPFFDLVVVDGPGLQYQVPLGGGVTEAILRADLVVLNGINTCCNYENHYRMVNESGFGLVEHDPGWQDGYAVFKKERELKTHD